MAKCINTNCNKEFYNQGYKFCSITCACEAGYFSVTKGWLKDPETGAPIDETIWKNETD